MIICEEIPYVPGIPVFPEPPYCLLHTARVTPLDQWSILGWDPLSIHIVREPEDPFVALDRLLAAARAGESAVDLQKCQALGLPVPRLMGLLTYDAGRVVEKVPGTAANPWHGLLAIWLQCRSYLMMHHKTERAWQICWERPAVPGTVGVLPEFAIGTLPFCNFSPTQYARIVTEIREQIAAGDCYQVNLSRQLMRRTCWSASRLFSCLVADNPASMMGLLDVGKFQIISTSPERLVRKTVNRVISRPIKGTMARAADGVCDSARHSALESSLKDRAELAMIIDLVRNDFGKVAVPGTVCVSKPRDIEIYTNVFHAVATVEASIAVALSWGTLLRAIFPGGSVTGCPKEHAMQMIERCEGVRRGIYCGTLGYIDVFGNGDWNIMIRTMLMQGDAVVYNVGGGVVYDSDPAAEYEETIMKESSMKRILENG